MLFGTPPRKYVYQPLAYWKPQIRLLRVQPDSYGSVRCSVEIFDLLNAPAYAALSYTWGPESPAHDIWIDGRTLQVRNNLYRFLKCRRKEKRKHFRSEKDLYLFIDQICIDQSDPEERSRQVQLMSQIYSKCWQVIVWLNDEHGQCTREAQAFSQPARRVLSLARLLQNDYFTRLWIVQELLLAPSICVFTPGNTWLWWPTVVKTTQEVIAGRLLSAEESAAWSRVPVNTSNLVIMTSTYTRERIHTPRALTSPSGPSWLHFAAKAKNITSSQDLLQVLTFSANICHEPRDKVYGLMSLLRLEHQLEVDYNKPIYDIFKEAVTELHSVVNFVDDHSYREWLTAVQRLGDDMGVNRTEMVDLFAFLEFVNVILPPQRRAETAEDASLPKLVSVIGVAFVDPPGSKIQSVNTDTTFTKTFEFNIIHELSSYWAQEEKGETITKQKRGDGIKQSITDIASLGDDCSSLSWYYRQDDQTFKYKIFPDWDLIFSIPLFRLARIVREFEDERTKHELSKKQEQPIITEIKRVQLKGSTQQLSKGSDQRPVRHRRTHRAIHYLAYGWVGFVGSLLVTIVVLCYVANVAIYLVPVTLGFGSYYMVARPKKLA